jgi:hypothetical protein
MMTKQPVDAIITWVDGYDKIHEQKLTQCLSRLGIERPEEVTLNRFNQCGEISYCVKSLLRFAPWIRTIFIVTDAQTPSIINQLAGTPSEDKIKLIDHRDIFFDFEDCLPTFNSLTIESVLWRIKGLSNNFIYLNDDCSLIRPVTYEDFFRGNRIVLRGKWKIQSEKKWLNSLKKLFKIPHEAVIKNEHRQFQEKSARLAGFSKHFFHLPHAPFAIKKNTIEKFFQMYPEVLAENVHHPLRHPQQFWPVSLSQHLEIKNKDVVIDNSLEAIYVNAAYHSLDKIQYRLAQADKNNNVAFICMQSIDAAPKSTQALMFNWLDKRIIL